MWRSWARPRAMPRCFVAALWTFSSPSARRHGCLEEMRQTLEVDRLQHALMHDARLTAPDERHLGRHHGHELHVGIERQARHVGDCTADVHRVHDAAWCTDWSAGAEDLSGVGERPLSYPWMPIVPFKLNQDRRHHIPRQRRTVTNWPAYDASLRQRGSLTVWFTEEAVDAWAAEPRTTRGGQSWYSPLAILTALTLRAVFRLAFRQTEGLIGRRPDWLHHRPA